VREASLRSGKTNPLKIYSSRYHRYLARYLVRQDPRMLSRHRISLFRCLIGTINAVYQQLQCRCCSTSTRLEKHATQNATGAISRRAKCGAFTCTLPAGGARSRNGTLLANPNPRNATFERHISHAGKSCKVPVCFHEPEQVRRYCRLPVKGLGQALIGRGGSLTRLMRLAWILSSSEMKFS